MPRTRRAGLGYSPRQHAQRAHEASADAIAFARKGDCFEAMLALGAAYVNVDAGSNTDSAMSTNARAAEAVVRARCEIRKRTKRS